jgi:integrase/recombinase XerD
MDDTELIRCHGRDQRRRGLTASSILKRRKLLEALSAALAGAGLLDPAVEAVETFLDQRALSPRSRYTYLSNLHSFYAWAIHAGHTGADPTLEIPRPRFASGLPRPISDADLTLALEMADPATAVMLGAGAYAGMRCCEIARLCREDIRHGAGPVIVAHGKGDKPRLVPAHPALLELLGRHGLPRSGPVLRRPDGRAMPSWLVSHRINGYLHGLGVDATAHQLRHWFGTTLYRTSGHDLLLVADLMGHASVTTTRVYAAWDRQGAAEAVAAMTPRVAA